MSEPVYEYHGSCECGAVSMSYCSPVPLQEQAARACQCQFCAPRNAAYLSHTRASLKVSVRDRRWLYVHRFATASADFFHCARCNTQIFVLSEVEGHTYALVSAERLEDFAVMGAITAVDYGSEVLAERLARRAQSWIPELHIIEHDAR